ncbi:pectate lyase [Mucilaginibacter arboris]|uniref:Pectate lyase n=1 Tax=Mucilaginibacter arboris TaxID=2682090 RepID=A0A7K1SZ22_9SPHI|nr:pectate lyase [Mucilaginibacter arboris]MVN22562.1 pectate lyase [Mucilaginibacter arboris]
MNTLYLAKLQQLQKRKLLLLFYFLLIQLAAQAQQAKITKIDTEAFGDDSRHWYGIAEPSNIINPKPNQQKYKPTDIVPVADNILLYQKNNGGWPKNYDIMAILTEPQKDSLIKAKNILNTTFDNGTTYTHVACLADVYTATHIEKYKLAALKGLDFIMNAQYTNGGWPQYYPLENNYSRHITYNDGVFEGIISELKAIADNEPQYAFVDQKRRQKLLLSYQKGLDCILKTQIVDNGVPTAWCQQHDEVTLQPAWARAFEPPSICDGESSGIVLFLMSIDHPTPQIIHAIKNAVAWFKASAIQNTRIKTVQAPTMQTKFRVSRTDKVVETDPTAPPIWTRYYELKTHKPLFCNRDSKVVYSLAEVDRERRDGYGWYTYAPQKAIDSYPAWAKKWNIQQ